MKLSILPIAALLASRAATLPSEVLTKDFPDPSITYDPQSGKWYTFATAGNGHNVQLASGPASTGPWTWLDLTILPSFPSWAVSAGVWAPDVQYLAASDSFVIYYSSPYAANTRFHCVGAATAKTITGPYTPVQEAVACPTAQGGAIDASGFYDEASATRWVVYKVDGNSIGHGGSCGNTVAPIVPTPIMMQQVAADGHTKIGDAIKILDRGDADGPLVEAPNLIKAADGTYILFFSSNCYSSSLYDISYATATALKGPYTKSKSPLLVTPQYNLTAPGGAQSVIGGGELVFHANCPQGRCLYQSKFTVANKIVTLV